MLAWKGNESSTEKMSAENRLIRRPRGVTSKNRQGAYIYNSFCCTKLARKASLFSEAVKFISNFDISVNLKVFDMRRDKLNSPEDNIRKSNH